MSTDRTTARIIAACLGIGWLGAVAFVSIALAQDGIDRVWVANVALLAVATLLVYDVLAGLAKGDDA